MYWANFIHLYQPPTQERDVVEKVTAECYRPLVRILQDNPQGRLTVNINGSLTEQLRRYGLRDVIDGLRDAAARGQIEFTGSAMYHPILPLIPEDQVRRQIRLNWEANREYFGDAYNPRGFFPPEMCYSRRLAEIVRDEGFAWIIVDEISYDGKLGRVRGDRTYTVEGLGDFQIFFKERRHSAALTYGSYRGIDDFLLGIGPEMLNDPSVYLLTGTDGEIYGHHHPGLENLLAEAFRHPAIRTCTVSELSGLFPAREPVRTVAASWSTWEDELERGIPYPQWDYPGHRLHELQWQLTDLALKAFAGLAEGDPRRQLLDWGLHSCQYWWASCRQYFNLEMIDKGADRLLAAVKACGRAEDIREAERLAAEIHDTASEWKQSGYARRLIEEYQRAHDQVTSELTFGGVR